MTRKWVWKWGGGDLRASFWVFEVDLGYFVVGLSWGISGLFCAVFLLCPLEGLLLVVSSENVAFFLPFFFAGERSYLLFSSSSLSSDEERRSLDKGS